MLLLNVKRLWRKESPMYLHPHPCQPLPLPKKQKSDQDDIQLEDYDVDVKAIKAEPEPSGSGASSAVPIVEADLGDESYGGAEGDDNGDFGAGDEFEGFDQYGDGAEFDDSLGAAGGSGAATDGKDEGVKLKESPDDQLQWYMVRVQAGYFKCRECPDLDFRCSGNLRAHVESHHYSPGYKCPNCQKMFKIRNVYSKHVKKCGSVVTWTQLTH